MRKKASNILQPESHSAQADFAETESFPPLQNGEGVPVMRAGERSTPADIADRYTFTHFLGRGTQGSVYAAERKSDSLPVAIKVLQISSIQNWKEYWQLTVHGFMVTRGLLANLDLRETKFGR